MFEIRFSEDGERHLKALSARDQSIVLDTIAEQLSHQPETSTRNRKQLRPNSLARWELRVQQFRVLYNVDGNTVTVTVVAIATKDGNRFIIEGKEHPL